MPQSVSTNRQHQHVSASWHWQAAPDVYVIKQANSRLAA
jgi:hypothetical protein